MSQVRDFSVLSAFRAVVANEVLLDLVLFLCVGVGVGVCGPVCVRGPVYARAHVCDRARGLAGPCMPLALARLESRWPSYRAVRRPVRRCVRTRMCVCSRARMQVT